MDETRLPIFLYQFVDFSQVTIDRLIVDKPVVVVRGTKSSPSANVVLIPRLAAENGSVGLQLLVVEISATQAVGPPVPYEAMAPIGCIRSCALIVGKTRSCAVEMDRSGITTSGAIITNIVDTEECPTVRPSLEEMQPKLTVESISWAVVALWIAEGIVDAAVGRAFNAIIDRIFPDRLKDFIGDTIEEFAQRITQLIEHAVLEEIEVKIDALQDHFRDYLIDPTSAPGQFGLTQAEYGAVDLIARIRKSDIGLKASHGAFMIVAGLRLAMLQEQSKAFPSRLRLLEKTARDYVLDAQGLYNEWLSWHESHFSAVFRVPGAEGGWVFVFEEYGRLFVPENRQASPREVEEMRAKRIYSGPEGRRLMSEVLAPTTAICSYWLQLAEQIRIRGRFSLQFKGGSIHRDQYIVPSLKFGSDHTRGMELWSLIDHETDFSGLWRIEPEDDWVVESLSDFVIHSVRCDIDGPYKGWYLHMSDIPAPSPGPERAWRLNLGLVQRPDRYRCGWIFHPLWNGTYQIQNCNWLGEGCWLYADDATGLVASFAKRTQGTPAIWYAEWTEKGGRVPARPPSSSSQGDFTRRSPRAKTVAQGSDNRPRRARRRG